MKKFIVLITMCFMLSGCNSILPRITMGTPGTLPQEIEKSKAKYKCSGKIEYYEDGRIKSCSKGYYSYEESYNKEERRMTIIERIKGFINGLIGWGFWGFVLLAFLCPGLIGLIAGRIIEAGFGVGKSTLNAISRAIQKVRKSGKDLNQTLESELDDKHKKYIRKLKDTENIK